MTVSNFEGIEDMANAFGTGSVSFRTFPSVNKNGFPLISSQLSKTNDLMSPPQFWAKQSDGWYKNLITGDTLTVKVKFTPDIWASEPPYAHPDKFEYYINCKDLTFSQNTLTIVMGWTNTFSLEYENTTKTSIKGTNNMNWKSILSGTNNGSQINLDLSYIMSCNYDGVTVAADDKSAHMTFSASYPFVKDGETNVRRTNISGEYKRNASGVGSLSGSDQYLLGEIKTNNVLFAKVYKTSTSKYYTLLSESWAIQHPIESDNLAKQVIK